MANLLESMGTIFAKENENEKRTDKNQEGKVPPDLPKNEMADKAEDENADTDNNVNEEAADSDITNADKSTGTGTDEHSELSKDAENVSGSYADAGGPDDLLISEALADDKKSEAEKVLRKEMGGATGEVRSIPVDDPLKIPDHFRRTNLVVCMGRIIRIETDWMGRGSAMIDVPVTVTGPREDTGRRQEEPFYPSFSVPLGSDNEQFLRFGTNVKITGHIEAFDRFDRLNDRYIYSQTFIADKVEPVPSEMEDIFGVKGRWIPTRYFRIYLGGEVYRVRDSSPAWGSLTVEVPGVGINQMESRIRADYFKGFGSTLPPFNQIRARQTERSDGRRRITGRGSFVYCSASLHISKRKMDDGRENTFENIRIDEISICGEDNKA